MERERIGLSFFIFTNRQLFTKLRRERRSLIRQLERYKDEYINLPEVRQKVGSTNG